MASRKWLFRSSYLAFVGLLVGGAFYAYAWTKPGYVRQELVTQLAAKFENVDVEVDSARLSFFGGIVVSNLRLTRKEDPTHTPFLIVPSAVLHHDKEQLALGKLVLRKIELDGATIRAERDLQGKWLLRDRFRPGDDSRAPIMVFRKTHLFVIDAKSGPKPIGEWHNVEATLMEDPIDRYTVDAKGDGIPTGPFALRGVYTVGKGVAGSVEWSALPLGADLRRFLAAFAPTTELPDLTGLIAGRLEATWQPDMPTPITYDLKASLRNGRLSHVKLPTVMDKMEGSIRAHNGELIIEKLTAQAQGGTLEATLSLAPTVANGGPFLMDPSERFAERLRLITFAGKNVTVTPQFLEALPDPAPEMAKMFQPDGPMDFDIRREGQQLTAEFRPQGVKALYNDFRYPVSNIRGKVTYRDPKPQPKEILVNLDGAGLNGATVHIEGSVRPRPGTEPSDVKLDLTGRNVTLDDTLINALPGNSPALVRSLRATARGDFVAELRQDDAIRTAHGPNTFDNRFAIKITGGSFNYVEFPYLLEGVTGNVYIRTVPDRPSRLPPGGGVPDVSVSDDIGTLEFRDFRGTHLGGIVRASGRKEPYQGGTVLTMHIQGESIPLDASLQQALAAIRVDHAWATFAPFGRTHCGIWVRIVERANHADFRPNDDLEFRMAFQGGGLQPTFFPYALTNVGGRLDFGKGRVHLTAFHGTHGPTVVNVPDTEVLLREGGGYWAEVRNMRIDPLLVDAAFLKALPGPLRNAWQGLALQGPMTLEATRLVIDDQPGPYAPPYLPTVRKNNPNAIQLVANRTEPEPRLSLPTIYWDAAIRLQGATLSTGVTWEEVHGSIASWGLYKGDRLGPVRGNVLLERARIARIPVEGVSAQLHVDPKEPNTLRIPSIRATLFGGEIGGEAWVGVNADTGGPVPGPSVRYAVNLNAARVRLEEIARHYQFGPKVQLEGTATAQLYLANPVDAVTGMPLMQGGGNVDVPSGKLLNLPFLLDLVKVVKLRMPDHTGFEEAHALFQIRGDRVRFGQLDLIGNAVSLAGEGDLRLDGQVNLEFYPVWLKVREILQLPSEWTSEWSKRFLKISVTGKADGALKYRSEPIPGIVEPMKRILGRMRP